MEEHSYRLIIEYFEKTISDEGLTQLQDWIEENPENQAQFIETIQILEASRAYVNQNLNQQKSWNSIQSYIDGPQKVRSLRVLKYRWLAVAALLLTVCTTGLIWYKQILNAIMPIEYAEVSNVNGRHIKIQLPDSSVVYLSGGSKIKYVKYFKGDKRDVYLNGEAFFDVVHKTKPFVVTSSEISTVVLGTSFNVKAYNGDKKVTVTVQSGKVGVMAKVNGQNKLVKYLTPNEQIEINTLNGLYAFGKTDASAVSSWISNGFNFYNTSLKDIAASLEHHYGVQIDFTDAELGHIKLTTKFNNAPLPQVMETLSELSGLAYTQKGNQFFFTNTDQKGGSIMR
ncbi:FecR family protein [Mucilaginibacter terrae]|uniref:Transmembrane sensor n=1 Tax=Mucilaginibacter terrae TaxID=1955052 RepID=A0ABU3GVM7_9SPHI|nr:FecR domain-containing protein [Mucilaginibacter terrae]MDT3403833.1 transmembrane sensor [Mucilaginibacter terrae]